MKKRYYIISSILIALSIVAGFFSRRTLVPSSVVFNRYSKSQKPLVGFNSLATPTYSVKPISLEEIFNDSKVTPTNNHIELIATGDVIPARSVNYQTITRNDFLWPYTNIQDILVSADLTLINLESPLLTKCPVVNEGMIFCGDARHIEGLVSSGVDVANVANNHFGNYGEAGIQESKQLLTESGILISGAGTVARKTVKGVRFAFVGFNDIGDTGPGIDTANDTVIRSRIYEAKNDSDVVIASFHWGIEYTHEPSERQITLAHQAIDMGADLVIGNHPHWIQPVELYKGKVIVYAHGNTIFDQMWSDETRYGNIGRYIYDGTTLVDIMYIPIRIDFYGQAWVLEGEERNSRLKILETISKD